jgi:hypothetical protein
MQTGWRRKVSHDFKEGDEVEIKTGGSDTWIFVGESQFGEAMCFRMNGDKKQQETFPFVVLRKKGPASGNIPLVRS